MSKNKKTVILLLIAAVLIAVVPLFVLKEAEFGGSDDAGSVMVEEIHGEYEPWFTPVLETALDRELPGEIESLIFCIQTGIGVGIIAFIMGRFVERKKWTDSLGGREVTVCRFFSYDLCFDPLLCGGFDRIYRKWNFDGRKGEDSSFLLCSTADDSDRIFDRRNRSCFFKSIESSYGCICRAGRGNIYNGKP